MLPLELPGDGLDTMDQIKTSVQQETGADASKLLLLHRVGGGKCSYLADDAVVEGFYPRFNLAMFQKIDGTKKFRLTIQVDNDTPAFKAKEDFPVRIGSDATIGRLKELIDEISGVPPLRQKLKLEFKNGFTLPIGGDELDEVVLAEVIPEGGVPRIALKNSAPNPALLVPVTVMLPSNTGIELSVELHRHTVNTVKREVYCKWKKKLKANLTLKTGAGELLDGRLTLAQSNIQAGDIIFLS